MGLNNSQYDTIMRQYSKRQLEARHRLEEHRREAYEKIPQLAGIDRQVAAESLSCARRLLEAPGGDTGELKRRMAAFSAQRSLLLEQNGFPKDYLEMSYACPDCQDTGYIGRQKCHCFRQAAIDLLYTQSGLRQVLEEENFSAFSLDYYPRDLTHPSTGQSARQMMETALAACHRYIEEFDTSFSNLFFYGATGLGKTFLSHCIARELIERTHSVIYYSAFDLFERAAKNAFGRGRDGEEEPDYIYDCDLLIIDDLGTELTNAFVSSQLFLILNQRIQAKKSTLISTNLSLPAFAETYSERVISRITSQFQLIQFFGNDIRLQKKLQGA